MALNKYISSQEILKRCFQNKSGKLKMSSGNYTVQDYFNAVYDGEKDSLRIDVSGIGLGTSEDSNKIVIYNSDGTFKSSGYSIGVTSEVDFGYPNKLATEEGVAAFVADNATLISAGNNIFLEDVEGTGIYDGKTLKQINAFGYKFVKRDEAVDGFASSYDLYISDANGNYSPVADSETINVVKDQYLKSATLVWGTDRSLVNGQVPGMSAVETEQAIYPFLKVELYVNKNGTSADDTLVSTIYIPVDKLFRNYIALANASQIQIAISNSNIISATVVSGSITEAELSNSVNASLDLADTAIQSDDVASILYTPNTVGATETNVKAYLDKLTDDIAQTDQKITTEIEKLDVTDTAVLNQYVSSVSETDGKIIVTRTALPVVSVTYDALTKELKVNNTAITTLDPETIGADASGSADNVKSIFYGRSVEFIDVTVTLNGNNVLDVNGCKSIVNNGVVTMTIPGRVICVYNASGNQIYPEVNYDKTSNKSVITADFGAGTVDSSWDVTYSRIISEQSSSSSGSL